MDQPEPSSPSGAGTPPPLLEGLPWESPSAGPASFFRTLYEIAVHPRPALAAPARAGWPRAVLFAALVWLLIFALRYLLFRMWSPLPGPGAGPMLANLMGYLLMAALFLLLFSGAVQLALRLQNRGGSLPPFAAVLRAVCYCQTSYVAMLLPMVGLLAHVVWNVILLTLALHLGLGLERRIALRAAALPMAAFLLLWIILTWRTLGG